MLRTYASPCGESAAAAGRGLPAGWMAAGDRERAAAAGLTANWLKAAAIVTMALDHFASGFLPSGSVAWLVLRTLGRLTMPIMCFFVAEGYRHTSSLRRYALRLLVFAAISHVPFVVYFDRDPLRETGVLWGLLMGLLALALWQQKRLPLPLRAAGVGALALLATPADWGYISVFWVVCFGVFRERPRLQLLSFTAVGVVFYLLPVAGEVLADPSALLQYGYRLGFLLPIPLLAAYRGAPGRRSTALKWGFYAFYPAHLLLLAALRTL